MVKSSGWLRRYECHLCVLPLCVAIVCRLCVLPLCVAFVCRLLCLYVFMSRKKQFLGQNTKLYMSKRQMSLCFYVFGNAPLSHIGVSIILQNIRIFFSLRNRGEACKIQKGLSMCPTNLITQCTICMFLYMCFSLFPYVRVRESAYLGTRGSAKFFFFYEVFFV